MRIYKDYINASCEISGDKPPLIYRKWAAISVIAGALGRKVWLDAGAFQVRPNQYIILIGGPASGKSLGLIVPFTVYSGLCTPIGTKKGDGDYNYKLETYGLEETPLYLIEDRITPEQLVVDLAAVQRKFYKLTKFDVPFWDTSLTIVTSEFGSFMSREYRGLQMLLTDLWNADKAVSHRFKNAGRFYVQGPCLNWCAATTPDQFIDNLPENARGQGFLSRLMPIYYDGARVEEELYYPVGDENSIENLRLDLAEIAKMWGPFEFTKEAEGLAKEDIKAGLPPAPTDPHVKDYMDRRMSHMRKLVMSVSASRASDRLITAEDWMRAKKLLLEAETQMPKILRRFGLGRAGRTADELYQYLLRFLQGRPKASVPIIEFKREIMRRVATPGEVEQTYQAMLASGLIRQLGETAVVPIKDK